MRERLKNIVAYISRSWEDEPNQIDRRLKLFPPFFLELLSYLIALSILYQIGAYLWSLI